MNCPRCAEELKQETISATEVDRCSRCNGLWLDPGEGEVTTRPEEVPEEVVRELTSDWAAAVSQTQLISCPKCGQQMTRERYAKSLVEIDRCACGVWLDGGEMEKITNYRRKRLQEIGDRYGRVNEANLERIYARVYFDVGHRK